MSEEMMKNRIPYARPAPYTAPMTGLRAVFRLSTVGIFVGLGLLSACAPRGAQAPMTLRFSTQDNPVVLNDSLELTAYPGSQILTLDDAGERTTARFSSNATLFALESHFETQLAVQGWRRVRYDPPNNTRSSVVYERAGERMRLNVVLEDTSGRYLLTLR